jgi:hypothetical protein
MILAEILEVKSKIFGTEKIILLSCDILNMKNEFFIFKWIFSSQFEYECPLLPAVRTMGVFAISHVTQFVIPAVESSIHITLSPTSISLLIPLIKGRLCSPRYCSLFGFNWKSIYYYLHNQLLAHIHSRAHNLLNLLFISNSF